MKLALSCAVVLHRVYDSAPPEKEPVFRAQGRVLRPYRKAGGLYVFVDEPEQAVEIACSGYQPEQIFTAFGETRHLFLFPDSSCLPPAGWAVTAARAPPGQVCFWPDCGCTIRLQSADPVTRTVRLRAKPGFLGGCLRLHKGELSQLAMIQGKEPPDLYYLDALDAEVFGEGVEKGYAGRADAFGNLVVVAPEGFAIISV